MFVECLYEDLENGEFYNVFVNKVLKYFLFVKFFVRCIEKKIYIELYFVFFLDIIKILIEEKLYIIRYVFFKYLSFFSDWYRLNKNVFCRVKGIYLVVFFGFY